MQIEKETLVRHRNLPPPTLKKRHLLQSSSSSRGHISLDLRGSQQSRPYDTRISFSDLLADNPSYERSAAKGLAISLLVHSFATKYCRLSVKGIENIPYGARFVWTHNHSGWLALDAILIGHLIAIHNSVDQFDWSTDKMGPLALLSRLVPGTKPGDWGVTFWNNTLTRVPGISWLIKNMHGLPAEALKDPKSLRSFRIFGTPAEGEEGNCKSSFTELYQLQRFRTGIARLALETNVDFVCPAVIIGPEESLPNFGKLRLLKNTLGTILPMPVAIPPIPVQWIVRFLPPIETSPFRRRMNKARSAGAGYRIYSDLSSHVREQIQAALHEELKSRKPFRPWFLG